MLLIGWSKFASQHDQSEALARLGYSFWSRLFKTLDSVIHWINNYPADGEIDFRNSLVRWIVIYPVDSVIQHLNNWGQVCYGRAWTWCSHWSKCQLLQNLMTAINLFLWPYIMGVERRTQKIRKGVAGTLNNAILDSFNFSEMEFYKNNTEVRRKRGDCSPLSPPLNSSMVFVRVSSQKLPTILT